MAGDWIKVEVGTASKTEVLRMAEMLGMERRTCMGLLVDYWSWLDANTRTDCVPNLSRLSLDSVMNCPGFSAALEAVGWAKWDKSGWEMTVVNYDHHNGSSAKTRASEQRKKREQRRDKTGTREREETEKRDTSLRSVSVVLATPTSDHEALAKNLGVSCQAEFQKYRDWLASSGKRQRDESAGFRNWLRKAGEFKARDAPKQTQADRRAAVADQIFGRGKHVANGERDITGTAERLD